MDRAPIHKQGSTLWLWRCGLVATGLFPLLWVAGTTLVPRSPWYRAWVRRRHISQIETACGLIFEPTECRVQQGRFTATGSRLRDPETGETVASVRWLQIRRDGNEQLRIAVSGVEIEGANWKHWLPRVRLAIWQSRDDGNAPPIRLAARDVSWIHPRRSHTWSRAEVVWEREANRVRVRCKLSPSDGKGWLHGQITRITGRPPRWSIAIHAERPGIDLAPWSEWTGRSLAALGPLARFQGKCVWEGDTDHSGWHLSGRFSDVDLNRLVTQSLPHKLSGMATARIEHLRVVDGRIVEFDGAITSRSGMISRGLLTGGRQWLGWTLNGNPADLPPVVPYQQLSIGFGYRGGRLRLWGIEDTPGEESVLIRTAGLTVRADDQPHSVTALVRTLLPVARGLVPSDSRPVRLLGWLYVPSGSSAEPPTEAAHVPLRLHNP